MVRLKNRWLLFEITYDSTRPHDLNLRDISSVVKESIGFNFGDVGLGSVLSSISGTIKKCQLAAIEYDRQQILALKHADKLKDEQDVENLLERSRREIMAVEI
ncbi:2259_t:CDS:2 [Paraglomus brasilianum]|uniref:2259_t:CDS:1 n=1 Tax=Paraglomus brasilianum TaxID=144538 RepID=A0A9N9FPL3_9GLOM|nr:2259_t:CDS:2 [Paraglomus brasilianum]